MSAYFLKDRYIERPQPEYFEDVVQDAEWQPNVYRAAAELARKLGCGRIVDIGCGYARKLLGLHPEFEIVGIDFGENIDHCRGYGFGTWLEWDIEREPMPQLEADGSVIICADVIEHLVDPLKLLHHLKVLLEQASVAILSTPERDLARGVDHMGPPDNECHVREWNRAELQTLLEYVGLAPLRIELTETSDQSKEKLTMMATIPGAGFRIDSRRGEAARA
jgi:SAM-dependent methyltransferase